jgi:hypothetical protein
MVNGQRIFYTLKEAQVLIEGWRQEYNTFKSHRSLNYHPQALEVWLHRTIKKEGTLTLKVVHLPRVRADHKTYVRRATGAKGNPDQPMTAEEVKAKFRGLAAKYLKQGPVKELIETIDML